MFLYNGAMDARFEQLCHRISQDLAIITSHHHRDDVDLCRSWRGVVHACVPSLSESHCGDAASFARSMWDQYLCNFPETEDVFCDVEHAYSDAFYAIRELMHLAGLAPCTSIGSEQERESLLEDLRSIDCRLHVLYARASRRRGQLAFVEWQKNQFLNVAGGAWVPPT